LERFGPDREPIRQDDDFERWWRTTGFRELRQVLLWRWDPLGVDDCFPATEDEYDAYARPVAELLAGGADAEAIVDLLAEIEHDVMSVVGGTGRGPIGEIVVEWYEQSRDSYREFGDRWSALQARL
jgi:hypothetical protein